MTFTGWFGFWLFVTVWMLVEVFVLLPRGFDGLFYTYKTPEEKRLQQILIDRQQSAGKEST